MFSPWNPFRVLLLLPFLCLAYDFTGPVPQIDQIPLQLPSENSIPYPGGEIYLTHGIYSSMAGGQYRNYGDPQNLYQWQGNIGYYYTPWFSGGVGFETIAGQPSDPVQKIKNRFFILGRFHKSWDHVSGYLGTQIGLDELDLSLNPDSGGVRQTLDNINAGIGLEFGLGWKFSRYVGLTFGQSFEASFVGEDTSSFGGSVNFTTSPGLAVDLLALAPSLRKNVNALYVFTEAQFGQLVLEHISKRQNFAWITGMSVAF